ncbi:hypothetical protein [Nocardioides sp. W7]|uniref:hypothetical protein n=1 Tax=Nocardioides sp. W7 TaxID=2931390 RepID=UPI001FD0BC29|nr:hypothetical protein [Nocardioides sp. W7]
MHRRTRVTVVAVVAAGTVTVALTAGAAFALWSADGSGAGAATTASAQNLTVTAAATDAGLWPGGPAGAVGFTATNPNPYPVVLTGVSYDDVDAGGACEADDVTLAPGAPTAVNVTVPANGTASATIPGVLGLAQTAGDECQGVTLTVDLALTGSQQ